MGKKKRTRKEQIENDLVPRLVRALQESGSTIYKEGVTAIQSALKSAAMIGGCGERGRTLELLRLEDGSSGAREIEREVIRLGVLEVLGYDESSTAASSPSRGTRRRKIPPRAKAAGSPFAGNR